MELLEREQIISLLDSPDTNSLFIEPLLCRSQIGKVTIDLRLGYDFLVSVLTRKPFIELGKSSNHLHRGISSYFQETRRDIGNKFVLYPNQTVLSTTLEYIALPPNVYMDILSRSSYTRLGIHINTMIQPGFRGCIPLELFNHGNNAIELVVGSRICQARLFQINNTQSYIDPIQNRKYYGDVRPTVSKADDDPDLNLLFNLSSTDS